MDLAPPVVPSHPPVGAFQRYQLTTRIMQFVPIGAERFPMDELDGSAHFFLADTLVAQHAAQRHRYHPSHVRLSLALPATRAARLRDRAR